MKKTQLPAQTSRLGGNSVKPSRQVPWAYGPTSCRSNNLQLHASDELSSDLVSTLKSNAALVYEQATSAIARIMTTLPSYANPRRTLIINDGRSNFYRNSRKLGSE